ncbi:MAG: homoserine dehydrogenase [Chloroflexi bacterium]|nr:homoserine dehydrogenase [Chloroflexota bacterium]MCY3581348.1 homoserine dehydrogenase [Chloroflexota bacterium]MCY3716385.1 homoserine dehydrogenase [Chloroflexota bacterium]MDE2649415.1 homoserine dehydrogenase [Chloroflexota bacterium]MXX51387.1 homoserine dehydrogenase [Chloroflexota bacterium]
MRLILIGFGAVGRSFAEILRDKANDLREQRGFEASIVGVITATRGSLYCADGLEPSDLLAAAETGDFATYPDAANLQRDGSASDMIAPGAADALLELSPTNLETAQPALASCYRALDAGLHLVLANKGPVALHYADLAARAAAAGVMMRCEATVMAGTPTLQLAQEALAGCEILSARGILNGTTNYILTQMESGESYAAALEKAQALGYAEADPSGDVDGWDAAGKLLILANALFGSRLTMTDLQVSGISHIRADDIHRAREQKQRYKLIAQASPSGGMVQAMRLPMSDPLASIAGTTNAITLDTDLLGAITLVGAGAGGRETGAALLADLLAIHRCGRNQASDSA